MSISVVDDTSKGDKFPCISLPRKCRKWYKYEVKSSHLLRQEYMFALHEQCHTEVEGYTRCSMTTFTQMRSPRRGHPRGCTYIRLLQWFVGRIRQKKSPTRCNFHVTLMPNFTAITTTALYVRIPPGYGATSVEFSWLCMHPTLDAMKFTKRPNSSRFRFSLPVRWRAYSQ